MRTLPAALCLILGAAPLLAQDAKKKEGPPVDQFKVDEAIRKGVAYLRTTVPQMTAEMPDLYARNHELVLWTFTHAGVPESDPDFQAILKMVLDAPVKWTYSSALQAMILADIDPGKYQWRIAQCAQCLVDSQSADGRWYYGEATPASDQFAPPPPSNDVRTDGKGESKPAARGKTKARRLITIKKTRTPAVTAGDNSNSQYAALGLRACNEAGIVIPPDVMALARKWWRESIHKDKGAWCYWGVQDPGHENHKPYGSMTAGAVGSLAIYDYILEKQWKGDPAIVSGLNWLGQNFTVAENPFDKNPGEVEVGHAPTMRYYYLYGLERAGSLADTEKYGSHWWYSEGAEALLAEQQANGSWTPKESISVVFDTCFAILFLQRATTPLIMVATPGKKKQ